MDELPESLKDEIDALDSLDARALRRRYAPLVADLPNCALSGVLRATVAYRLQKRHYGLSLSNEATASGVYPFFECGNALHPHG